MRIPVTVQAFVHHPGRRTAAAMAAAVKEKARQVRASRTENVPGPPARPVFAHGGPDAEVVVYFADDPRRLYQLQQWLPVFEQLHRRHPVLLVFRHAGSMRQVSATCTLPAVYARRLADLTALYDAGDYKCAIYVNNGVSNFQSLAAPTMLHVHVNHGESDKLSMVSNQAKAYDRVFVAGTAAIRRHRAALIDFDESRLVPVGRPQLDLTFPPLLPPSPRRTVLYAPTWEGENDFNNYTSVDRYGVRIVQALLSLDDVRLVYKPHPRIRTSRTIGVAEAHERICGLISAAARAEPAAGHTTLQDGSILALFPQCDAIVTDVSSVGLDFLYLRTERPLFLTDRRDDPGRLAVDAPVSAAADIIDSRSIGTLRRTIADRLEDDTRLEDRRQMREFYFGDLAPGESTRRFLDAIDQVIADRDRMLTDLPRHHEAAEAAVASVGVSDDPGSEVRPATELPARR